MSDERRRFMSNPNIAEAGRAPRFAPGLKSTRDASEKAEITETLGIGEVTLQAAALFEIGKRAAGGDSKALDYLIAAAGDPKDDLWDFCI